MKIRCNLVIILTVYLVSLIQDSLNCVVSPSDRVAIAGEKVSLSCNARPNNERQGTVSKWTLGSEGESGTLIYQPPVYGPNGKVNVEQKVADGYFLSYADEDLINVTIQINKTQLRHGGKYFCICAGTTSQRRTTNLVILDSKLTFIMSKGKNSTQGETRDLNCSMSFNGSTSAASVDLTILNATGELLANRSNLQLMQDAISHHVTHRVVASQARQNFTCEMKVWTKSHNGTPLLCSTLSKFLSNWGHEPTIKYETTPGHSAKSANIILFAVPGAIGIFIMALLIFVLIRKRGRCHERKPVDRRPDIHIYGQPRYTETTAGGRVITLAENNGFMVEENEDQQNCKVHNELLVFDNVVYDASPRFDPSRQTKVEQIYNEIL